MRRHARALIGAALLFLAPSPAFASWHSFREAVVQRLWGNKHSQVVSGQATKRGHAQARLTRLARRVPLPSQQELRRMTATYLGGTAILEDAPRPDQIRIVNIKRKFGRATIEFESAAAAGEMNLRIDRSTGRWTPEAWSGPDHMVGD
jgi:hypothetical protein